MNINELKALIDRKVDRGLGDKDITLDFGWKIRDVDYCTECDQFHIITERIVNDTNYSN